MNNSRNKLTHTQPQNLLLSSRDENATIKVADFGFARFIEPQSVADTLCGSPLYMVNFLGKFMFMILQLLSTIERLHFNKFSIFVGFIWEKKCSVLYVNFCRHFWLCTGTRNIAHAKIHSQSWLVVRRDDSIRDVSGRPAVQSELSHRTHENDRKTGEISTYVYHSLFCLYSAAEPQRWFFATKLHVQSNCGTAATKMCIKHL